MTTLLLILATLLLIATPTTAQVNSTTIWGACSCFAVHSDVAISFAGVTTDIHTGDIGVSPGVSITGSFLLGTGANDAFNAASAACTISKVAAITALTVLPGIDILAELGGQTISPGVYCASSFTISAGILTLDGAGNPDAVFVFKTASTLITSANTSVVLINGAQAKNVYFLSETAATIGADSTFVGQLLAKTAITISSNAVVTGRVFAQVAVTFASNSDLTSPVDCTVPIPSPTPSGPPSCVHGECPADWGTYNCIQGKCVCKESFTYKPDCAEEDICRCIDGEVMYNSSEQVCVPKGRCIDKTSQCKQHYGWVKCLEGKSPEKFGNCVCNYGFCGGAEEKCICKKGNRILWSTVHDGEVCLKKDECTTLWHCTWPQRCYIPSGTLLGTCS